MVTVGGGCGVSYVAQRAKQLADTLPDAPHQQSEDDRRVHALDSEGIVRVEGHGPVTEAWVRRFLGPHARFTIRPVLDLAGQAPVDCYEIPDRHRRAVHLMTPADTFPFGSCLSRDMQVDHTIPYDQGGVSAVGSYGPMITLHHRIKTHGAGWQVKQPFPGIYLWRDPHRGFYLVDHTGTRTESFRSTSLAAVGRTRNACGSRRIPMVRRT